MRPSAGTARAWIESGEIAIELEPGVDELTDSTRFEIGSIVKTMTATLLATYVVDGTVALDDPLSRWLDAGACSEVTLGALATHTSGLPRLPPRMRWSRRFRPGNPYAHFGADDVVASLGRVRLRTPGRFSYSNFGYMVLGHVLSLVGGATFETLLRGRVLAPAGVEDVAFDGDEGVIQGYSHAVRVPHWDHPLGGAGGVRASVRALADWVNANLSPPASLCAAMSLTHEPQMGAGGMLGWMPAPHDAAVRWHNGGTGGFSSFCGFNPVRGVGIGLLTNSANENVALDSSGIAALRGE
jgi:serine-type D-Ala-D-Ala carboxypeptidase/endopeptidase